MCHATTSASFITHSEKGHRSEQYSYLLQGPIMGCDLFKPIQLSERPAFLPPIRNKKMGLGQEKKNKQQTGLEKYSTHGQRKCKRCQGKEIGSYLSGLAAVAEKFLDESTKAGNYLMFMDILMASWKSELNLLGRDREDGIEIYLHALQVSIIRVKSVEPLS